MTVMIGSFFGVDPYIVRSGLWGRLKPGAIDLYIYLMEESERHCTRRLRITDADVRATVQIATRTLCDVRKQLQEHGLIRCERSQGNVYTYSICDPRIREPYPGDPKKPIVCPRRSRTTNKESAQVRPASQHPSPRFVESKGSSLQIEGLPDLFP